MATQTPSPAVVEMARARGLSGVLLTKAELLGRTGASRNVVNSRLRRDLGRGEGSRLARFVVPDPVLRANSDRPRHWYAVELVGEFDAAGGAAAHDEVGEWSGRSDEVEFLRREVQSLELELMRRERDAALERAERAERRLAALGPLVAQVLSLLQEA